MAVLVENLESHVVFHLAATARNVDAGFLAGCHLLEEGFAPVNVRIEIGVLARARTVDLFLTVTQRFGGCAAVLGFVVKLHVCCTVNKLGHLVEDVEGVLDLNVDVCLRVVLTALGGDDHNTVGTARTVDCGCGGVLQH